MDRATVIGIISGFVLLIRAIMQGGEYAVFWDFSSVLITVGGTLSATLISYHWDTFIDVLRIAKKAFTTKEQDLAETINTIVQFADKARREGLLALDQDADELDDPFLQKGIRLVVDGTTQEFVRNILETELAFIAQRHKIGHGMFETMGGFAPAFGMLGTLVGLIQMLAQLQSPEHIGSGMAVALVTTFYGSVLSNMVFLPIANKLKARSSGEIFIKEAIIEGVLSIQAGDNPRIVQEKLKSFLSPRRRGDVVLTRKSREVIGSETAAGAR
jgi:chemotaxis protein MotA